MRARSVAGFTLMEIVIAMGVGSILMLALTQMYSWMNQSVSKVQGKGDFMDFSNEIRGITASSTHCTTLLGFPKSGLEWDIRKPSSETGWPVASLTLPRTGQIVAAGSTIFGAIKITEIAVKTPGATLGSDTWLGSLVIKASKNGSPLLLDLPMTFVDIDENGQPETCQSAGTLGTEGSLTLGCSWQHRTHNGVVGAAQGPNWMRVSCPSGTAALSGACRLTAAVGMGTRLMQFGPENQAKPGASCGSTTGANPPGDCDSWYCEWDNTGAPAGGAYAASALCCKK